MRNVVIAIIVLKFVFEVTFAIIEYYADVAAAAEAAAAAAAAEAAAVAEAAAAAAAAAEAAAAEAAAAEAAEAAAADPFWIESYIESLLPPCVLETLDKITENMTESDWWNVYYYTFMLIELISKWFD